jgi:large subunit ribosomal protein L19
MKLIQDFIKKHSKSSVAQISTGDVVRVHETIKEGKKERIQIFEGIVISKKGGQGLDGTFTVRKVSFGVGVEKIYPLHMPTIIKIEVVKKIKNKQSKLYYLRHLTDKQIQKRSELSKYSSWEDETAKQEEEALKKKNEEEAKKKDEQKEKEKKELEKKFAQTRGSVDKQEGEKKQNEPKNDQKNQKPGK